MAIQKDECFRKDIILDFFNVMRLLRERGYGDLHDEMFAMWPDYLAGGNDSYWPLYRDWIGDKNPTGQTIWDAICAELEIDQDLPKVGNYQPSLRLVFWVSW